MGTAIAFVVIFCLIVWFGMAKITSSIAASKGYSKRKWFWYGFFMGFIALLHAGFMGPKRTEALQQVQ